MDCTICGKASLPGAMLCAPCKAALRRARYVTVQEDMRRPSIIDVRRQPRRARRAPTEATPESSSPSRGSLNSILNSNSGRPLLIGILAFAALGTIAYFGHQESGARSQNATSAAQMPAPDVLQQIAVSAAKSQPPDAEVAPSPVEAVGAAPAGVDLAPQTQPAIKPGATVAAKRTMLASRATFATVNGDPPDAVNPPPEPERPQPAPAPPPRAAPDRWQLMRDALAQCDKEGMINGLICGQRVRVQYCEGYWGKVDQCAGTVGTYER